MRTITLDRMGDVFCTVSLCDYEWARKVGPWFLYLDNRRLDLRYARRTIARKTFYMHRMIMLRTGIKPPTRRHVVVDHKDGNGLNNTRDNLRWFTKRDNRLNIGSYRDNLDLFNEKD